MDQLLISQEFNWHDMHEVRTAMNVDRTLISALTADSCPAHWHLPCCLTVHETTSLHILSHLHSPALFLQCKQAVSQETAQKRQ